jgi:hypothetical protein
MIDGKQNNARRISFAEQDPCLSGVVRSRDARRKLHNLESREMSAYESAIILSRLLAPDAQDATEEPQRRPAGSLSSFEMLAPALTSAS